MTEDQALDIVQRLPPQISGVALSLTPDAAGEWGVYLTEEYPGKPIKRHLETDYRLVLRELGLGKPMEE